MLLASIDQINESEKRFNSFKKTPAKHVSEAEDIAVQRQETPAPDISVSAIAAVNKLVKRKEMLEASSREPVDFAFERAIGKNDSVYSNFCELISNAKKKICRIVVKEGTKNTGFATGFMVSERLMLTNWHVFQTEADVGGSEVEFDYELDINGREKEQVIFKLSSKEFFYSNKELDYCLVAVASSDIKGTRALSDFGYLYLDPALGKLGQEGKELLNIIHHPDGDFKQLSIRENKFTKMLDNTIWYETDTAPGSSGSPVFNDQWQVVALHHMGVPSKSSDGKNYLDKKGNIIGTVNGKTDISKICWIANEGIRISILLDDAFSKHPNSGFINGLKSPSKMGSEKPVNTEREKSPDNNSQQKKEVPDTKNADSVQVSFPASLLEAKGSVSIVISTPQNQQTASTGEQAAATANQVAGDAFLSEIAKLQVENSMNYSECRGYQSGFLDDNIPIPKPNSALKKFVVKKTGSESYILRYHHFSAIFHSVRRMPVISAINIDGDSKKRLDMEDRVDLWLRDNRIDYSVQLDDKYYALSGFDRGHMSRREDADWALTAELAKKYADLTCVYTNACPQVPALNRSNRSGLWGKLETVILEKGAGSENGQASKISVFNGPVFADSDPVYKGIQVPMDFWKIILWYNAAGQLQATAFKLSQVGLVDDIDFEELDFDSNVDFQQYQCSIVSLQALTNLNFSHLVPFDTFSANANVDALKINSEEEFRNFVNETFHVQF